jgi:ATP-dependent helicase HrpB
MLTELPIDAHLGEIVRALGPGASLVLRAEPGAGKTTRVPPALLPHVPGEIVVLEPRRLAARLAAERVADEQQSRLGELVGYQVRFEDVSSARTRIRFVTEGILTRRLLSDRTLQGTSTVVLDEFHERHLQGDIALALLRRLQATTRKDLRLVVMSATLDTEPLEAFLGGPSLAIKGRTYPITVEYEASLADRPLEVQVAAAVRSVVKAQPEGDVLVFLPGAAEIRRCIEACQPVASSHDLMLVPLHGDLPSDEQSRAVRRQSKRKVILSTNVAESSVTIDGVRAVIDAGLVRMATFEPWSGLPQLRTQKASRASLTQRAGRAGRLGPGFVLRLFPKSDFDARPEFDAPEIERSDLAQTALELSALGHADLDFFTPPPQLSWDSAKALLARLGALGPTGELTPVGERMMRFPLHPRLARIIVAAAEAGVGEAGALACAIMSERELRSIAMTGFGDRRGPSDTATEMSDVVSLMDAVEEVSVSSNPTHAARSLGLDAGALAAVRRASKNLSRIVPAEMRGAGTPNEDDVCRCILHGFPDRVAKRQRPGSRSFALAQGGSAELAETSTVRDAEYIVCVAAESRSPGDRGGRGVRIRTASGIKADWLLSDHGAGISFSDAVEWSERDHKVTGKSRMMYEALVLEESDVFGGTGQSSDSKEVQSLLFEKAKERGAHSFAPAGQLAQLLGRAKHAKAQDPNMPEFTMDQVHEALFELCKGRRSFAELEDAGLMYQLGQHVDMGKLARLAPTHVALANGRKPEVHYEEGKPPYIESFLQDFCGTKESPKAGNTPLVLHLLAPNRRAVQITQDLPSFFSVHYPKIRKELMRKYPRHGWPEDPSVIVPMKPQRPPRS